MRATRALVTTGNPASSHVYKYSEYLAFILHAKLITLIRAFTNQAYAQDIAGKALAHEFSSLAFSYPAIGLRSLGSLTQAGYGPWGILVQRDNGQHLPIAVPGNGTEQQHPT